MSIVDPMNGGGAQDRPAAAAPNLKLAQLIVASLYGLAPEDLLAAPRKHHKAVEARQVAMYLSHVVLGLPFAVVARGFARDRTTARHACRLMEERREDPEQDRKIAWMEALLRKAAGLRLASEGERL